MAPNSVCYFDVPGAIVMLCLGSMAYGLHLAVAGMTCYFAMKQSKKLWDWKHYYAYIGLLLLFSSTNYFLSTTSYLKAVSGKKDYVVFTLTSQDTGLVIIPEVMAVLVAILCNSLLMYRCYVVWNGNKFVLILPCLVFAAAIISGFFAIFGDMTIIFGSYWPLLLILNFTLSALICGRILWLRRQIQRLLGTDHQAQLKSGSGVIALVVESSLIYTVVTLVGIAFLADDQSHIPYVFSPFLVHTECIASELIILRVVFGRAVTQTWTTTIHTRTTQNRDLPHTPMQFSRTQAQTTTITDAEPPPVYLPK